MQSAASGRIARKLLIQIFAASDHAAGLLASL